MSKPYAVHRCGPYWRVYHYETGQYVPNHPTPDWRASHFYRRRDARRLAAYLNKKAAPL